MRCWRIMTVGGGRDNDLVIGGGNDQLMGDDHDVCPQQKLELSFEYLMNTGELRWVTVVSTQAILMSLCLQSMVEELLRIRSGAKIKTVKMRTEIDGFHTGADPDTYSRIYLSTRYVYLSIRTHLLPGRGKKR